MELRGSKLSSASIITAISKPAPHRLPKHDLKLRAEAVAKVAAVHADQVDREGKFPEETFAAVREQQLLGILVPPDLGGEGASVSDVVDVCYVLGKACASSAMIFAMHQIMVACLVRHGPTSQWHRQLLRRLCAEQKLLASSTTEGQGGGDLRSSASAIEYQGSHIAFAKSATVVSYGLQADGIVTTARRASESPSSDQVLVAFLKEDYALEHLGGWDALGMRGTCSAGFMFKGRGEAQQNSA